MKDERQVAVIRERYIAPYAGNMSYICAQWVRRLVVSKATHVTVVC